ncbi:short transient receptor potential channel 4-like isoform X1 [Harmonia axyridis]|uniref:short transient receptor potential channel 4-like isoform X1 n=1 Tax=Harmonia axyridis TaxID=115357 RepID=UPI001E2763EC|nr:short transient receptor potential channel 4-like isoform X1 [Harmonia axyridis]
MRRTAASDLPPRGLITQRAPTLTDIPVRHLPSAPPLPTRVHTQPFLAHASVPGGLTQSGNYRRFEDLDYEIAPKSSILLPHLQANEKKFFELVHSGDVEDVRKFLENNLDFNINCVNFQGVSALLVAVQTRNDHMVEFLISQNGIDIGDAVLHAVRDNQLKIVELLLEKLHSTAPSLEFVGVTHSSDFPDYMTPLILAAQEGHFEIIEMLIQRGHVIAKPHSPKCRCDDCILHLERDDLLHAETLRLDLYKAITNPAFICHSTNDPILTAFQLCAELRLCAWLVVEFRDQYQELADAISDFAVELIACCRSTTEMEIILTQTGGLPSNNYQFPRLVLAMDLKQKSFVAHPNTQQLVEAAWVGDWHDYIIKPTLIKLIYPIYRIIVLPFICLMCIFIPSHPLVLHWRIPLNKMISHTAGYLVFLVIIFLESNISKENQKRKPPNSGLEPVICVFVAGYTWNCFRMCLIQGPSRYFRALWNWHAVLTNMFFILTFLFWIASYWDAKKNDQVDLERKYWNQLDPVLISEGTFAVATVMAYFRLMFFCRLNYYMGPVQISLGKMCADIAKYLTIFIIILISFTCAMCRFYQYYDGMVQVDENGIKTQQVSSFVNFQKTLKTFFWGLLGMSPLESADVIIANLPGPKENTTIINSHDFTENMGYVCFAVYEMLTMTMIMNMLIATMSSTFQRVLDNLNTEWTFWKTDFYLEYMIQSTLPPPLNLIPTQLGFNLIKQVASFSANDAQEDQRASDYNALISQLVQRYFREKDTVTTTSEIEELRQEINELKLACKDLIDIITSR